MLRKKKKKNPENVKYPILGNERTLQESCIMSIFDLLRYQNGKTPKRHSIWRKNNITKIRILRVFYIIRYHSAKVDAMHPIGGKNEISRIVYFQCL